MRGAPIGVADAASTRLPRGRHGLSRAEVATAQRDRLMLAMAEVMADRGYVGTSVADVIACAGVSRETFYQRFDSKLDCFLASFDAAAEVLFAPLVAQVGDVAVEDGPDVLHRFDALLGAYLHGLATRPAHARLFLVEVYAAGPDAIARRVALQATISEAVASLLGVDTESGRFACQALVAAISALVTPPLVAGELDALVALREPLVDLVARAVPTWR